jgi:hypothetical protein
MGGMDERTRQREAVDRLMDVTARVMDFERDLPRLRSDLRSVTTIVLAMEQQIRKGAKARDDGTDTR